MSVALGVLGSRGRMGTFVKELIQNDFSNQAKVHALTDHGDDMALLLTSDCVIDFSSPDAVAALAKQALESGAKLPAFVIGSTGWKQDAHELLSGLASKTPVLISSNFSTGVLALLHILKQASPLLSELGYTPSIVETHHIHKKDSPSGTALSIQKAIDPKAPSKIKTKSIREGEVIGDHEVTFQGPDDRLVLGHFANSRSVFARGAIRCALWLAKKKKPGFYAIDDFFKEISP